MPKSTYDVIKDFGVEPGAEYLSFSPYWLICVFRLKYPTTYNRNSKSSLSTLYSDAVELRGDPMVITDDVLQMQVSSSKTSYLMQLNASLVSSGTNYLSEIFPGDYVMAWMVNNKETYEDLVSRVSKLGGSGKAVNQFSDGLKFVGRVQSLRKKITQVPDGARFIRYALNAISFNEFDSQLFYEPHLAEKEPKIGNYFGRLGTSLNELVKDKAQGHGIDINKALPFFLDLLLGKGVPPNIGRGNSDSRLQSTTGLTAPYAYILPDIIGQALGKKQSSTSGGIITYADILEAVIGIQTYSSLEFSDDERALIGNDSSVSVDQLEVAKNFQPDGTRGAGSRRFTNDDMLGEFLPQVPHFYNKSVWAVLQQYLNPAVNEMYTCLRVNPDGAVVPTLMVRQLPFTSKFLTTELKVTRFLELPRWGIDEVLVQDVDIGRSDSVRFNFVHVYGDSVDHSQPFAAQVVRNPPIRDDLDIARSGLRSHMQTVPCAPADTRNGSPAKWMEIVADILMGQQLTLTGVMTTYGIQAPICPGDNVEWDGVVFHIESVTHTCSIGGDGKKVFRTTLALSHGVRSDPGTTDTSIYAGISTDDQQGFDPGLTKDSPQDIDVDQRPGGSRDASAPEALDVSGEGTLV